MSEDAIEAEVKPVYFHDCPAIGPQARLPRALLADAAGEYVLAYHHKCPFCGATGGKKELALGVKETPAGGYSVDTDKAEKLRNV